MRTIIELFEANNVEEANEKLKEGWRLHSVFGTPEKRVYILVLHGEA